MNARSSRWCPWCGAELATVPSEGVAAVCGSCNAKIPAGAALTAPRDQPLRPGDPDASIPPAAPPGAEPLPAGAPTMTEEALVRWAVIFVAIVVAIVVLALAIGRPIARRVRPTPPATPSPAPTSASALFEHRAGFLTDRR